MCVLAGCSLQFTGNSDFISTIRVPTYFTLMPSDTLNIYQGRAIFPYEGEEGAVTDFSSKLLPVKWKSRDFDRPNLVFSNYLL